VVVESRGFAWPHDATVLPTQESAAPAAASWRAEGTHPLSVVLAELEGKRLRVLDVKLGELTARGVSSLYG
jgi:hypothetical protein